LPAGCIGTEHLKASPATRPADLGAHGELALLTHAFADAGPTRHAEALIQRLSPLAHCIANIGQVGVVGPVALALARLHAMLGDTVAARRSLDRAHELAERSDGQSSLLRCRLLAAQLDTSTPAAVFAAIAAAAEDLGMAAVAEQANAHAALARSV
jgi:hypothetical protein